MAARKPAQQRKPPPPAAAMPSILDALDDPALFASHFTGMSWRAWRAFLAALFGLPMTEAEAAIYREHTGRTTPPAQPFAEAALIVGRRGGKSRVLASIAVFLATMRDYQPFLAPGEVATVAILAANRAQARSIFRYVQGLLKAVPLLAPLIAEEGAESITLSNRVVIEISTASFRTTRGYSFAAVLCDEIAFWRQDETSANPDTEILRALRPGMASIPGSILLLASSPYAKRGELYQTFRRHYGEDDARVLVWKADTAAMNPRIDPRIIAEAYEQDPESARAEYGAEFRDDLADFVTREVVDAVTCWGRAELPPEPGMTYTAFVDPSGGASDAMTLAIGHLGAGNLAVLDAVREVRPPFDPEQTVAEMAALLRRYGIDRVTGDRYGGEWPRQRFREHGISYEPSARPKSDIYIDLLPLLNARRVELLDNPRLSAQLVGLERRTARSGKDSVDHAPGGHDDLVNAAAGVLVGLDLDRRPSLIPKDAVPVTDAPADLGYVRCVYAVLWIGHDGTAAYAVFALSPFASVPLALLDFDAQPWAAALLGTIAEKLDAAAEAARDANAGSRDHGVSALLYAPDQLVGAGIAAMSRVFSPRLHRHDALHRVIAADPIDAAMLADPVKLTFAASAHASAGKLRVVGEAARRSQALPLLGSLTIRPGETIDGDPLRLALLLGVALALEPEPSHAAPPIPAASVVFR